MLKDSQFVKIKVTVPYEAFERVRHALGEAGAGRLGNYDHCSYSYPVKGKFRPLEGAHPAIGDVGKHEEVDEICIECICHKDKLQGAIEALRRTHPYEEPAIDILPRYEIE
ncbi:MAG TPA: hypothetical protein DCS29_04150 [Candidatus Magasanikbacteria bacterium]|nr:MAG: hypothetical protein A2479_02320 [Candidatus Magasanikbacteria bacterium RIFOXYC2_FULL_39_8]HAT03935.1 hypothetical protein [Candidatus Magasanikbacteria bacterium]